MGEANKWEVVVGTGKGLRPLRFPCTGWPEMLSFPVLSRNFPLRFLSCQTLLNCACLPALTPSAALPASLAELLVPAQHMGLAAIGSLLLPADKLVGWLWMVRLLEGSDWPEWLVCRMAMLFLTILSSLDHLNWCLLQHHLLRGFEC